MEHERRRSHRGRWTMLYVLLGFVGLSIFALADAVKAPVVFQLQDNGRILRGVVMTDGSIWKYDYENDDTVMLHPPAR